MNIHEALTIAENGGIVRRKKEDDYIYLVLVEIKSLGMAVVHQLDQEEFEKRDLKGTFFGSHYFEIDDIQSEDWEIVEVKKQ